MSIARKILWNTVSQLIGKVFVAVIGVFVIKIITNYLGKTGYGEYSTAYDFVALFIIISDLGLHTIGIREMSRDTANLKKIIGNILTVRIILALLVIFIAGVLAHFIPQYQNSHIPTAVWLVGGVVFLNLIAMTISSVLQVYLKMEYSSLASIIGRVINLAYMVFVVYAWNPTNRDIGFYQMIVAGIIGNGAILAVTWYHASKLSKIRLEFDFSFIKDMLAKALPYGIALILSAVLFQVGSIALSLFRTKAEVGIYGLPMRMMDAIAIIPLYFMNAVFPPLTRAINRRDGSHEKVIQYAFDFLVIGGLPIVLGAYVLSYPLISIVSSPEFLSNPVQQMFGSDKVLPILILGLLFSFVNSLFGYILIADNRQGKILLRNLIGVFVAVALNVIFVPRFGVKAAAYVNVVTGIYISVSSYFIARHYLKFRLNPKNALKAAFCAVVMAACIYFIREPFFETLKNKSLFVLIPLGAAIYTVMLFFTGTVTKEMLDIVKKKPQVEILPEDL